MISELLTGYMPPEWEQSNPIQRSSNTWKQCHSAFSTLLRNNYQAEALAQQLMSYLESPQVRMGCNMVLVANLNLHIKAVAIIAEYPQLYCTYSKQCDIPDHERAEIFELFKRLKRNYAKVKDPAAGRKHATRIIVTDTFITKIMLGALGCIPAFDSVVHYTLTNCYKGKIQNTLTRDCFTEIIEKFFYDNEEFKIFMEENCNEYTGYTPMKALDLFLINSTHKSLFK